MLTELKLRYWSITLSVCVFTWLFGPKNTQVNWNQIARKCEFKFVFVRRGDTNLTVALWGLISLLGAKSKKHVPKGLRLGLTFV